MSNRRIITRSASKKNKLSSFSPAESSNALPDGFSSDEFDYADKEDLPEGSATKKSSAPGEDDYKSNSSAAARQKLPLNVQRQLLADIIERGGVGAFGEESNQALRDLCDKRPLLFGSRGSNLRVRIGRKVARWKIVYSQGEDKWSQYCARHQLRLQETKKDKTPAPPEPSAPQEDSKLPARVAVSPLPPVVPATAAVAVAACSKQARQVKRMEGNMRTSP